MQILQAHAMANKTTKLVVVNRWLCKNRRENVVENAGKVWLNAGKMWDMTDGHD